VTTSLLEKLEDANAIRRVNEQAFDTPAEAGLVGLLGGRGELVASLVAEDGDRLLSHIPFGAVSIISSPTLRSVGIGPMAVVPVAQMQGIGSELVRAGLDRSREMGNDYAGVLGPPEYYPRFGLVPASQYGITRI